MRSGAGADVRPRDGACNLWQAFVGIFHIQDWIAESRVEIDQARLLVLRAAWAMDKFGNKAARTDVSAIKLVAARLQTRVVDRAIQVFGAAGLTPDTPLAYLWTWAVHCVLSMDQTSTSAHVARAELNRRKQQRLRA